LSMYLVLFLILLSVSFFLACFYIKAFPGKYTRTDLFVAYAILIIMSFIGVVGFILFWTELFGVSF
jgi:hypothetical protein